MGRNATPKIGEWRDGKLYEVKERNGMTVATCTTATYVRGERIELEEVLACFYNDSFAEAIFSTYQSGYDHGVKAGVSKAQLEIKKAMGLLGTE